MTFGKQGGVVKLRSHKLQLALLLWWCSSGGLLVALHSHFLLLDTILGVVVDGRSARHVVIVIDLRVARLGPYVVLHLHPEMMALWLIITVVATVDRVLYLLEIYTVQGARTLLLQLLFRRVNL